MSNVVVIGMGYVGIPVAVLLARAGHNVTGIQRRSERSGWKIDALNRGECPIANEPELPEMLKDVVGALRFHVTSSYAQVEDADYILIDVQTPVDENHAPRYESLKEVCGEVAKRMNPGVVVIVESTVVPGTTLTVVQPILESSGLNAGADFGLCFSYERVMVGKLVHNIRNLPKIVGGIDTASVDAAKRLYTSIVLNAGILTTDILTAEVAKVTENAYRDVQIAFANQVALICETLGVDVYAVRALVNSLSDRHMLLPGAGVGGHCLPKDPWLLLHGLPLDESLLATARDINDSMPYHMAYLVEDALTEAGVRLETSRIAVLGYAFLANSDDDRNTPTLPLLNCLRCADVKVHDPYVKLWNEHQLSDVLDGCDAVVLMVAHDAYRSITPSMLSGLLRTKVLVDGRNLFDLDSFKRAGFVVRGVGKGQYSNGVRHDGGDCVIKGIAK